ncbi:MAG: chromosomal replication initiator protein DnaA [Actinomycetia bacterium]|nr:chromosomal replication initiator protein DnaA [Actinomycetes bacterium]
MDTTSANPAPDVVELWTQVVETLDPPTRALLARCQPLMLHSSTVMVSAPDEFTRERMENRLRSRIEEALSDELGDQVRIAVTIAPPSEQQPELPVRLDDSDDTERQDEDSAPKTRTRSSRSRDQDRLNPRYTLETFVIGPSNRFAHAAAVAVAEAPGKSYNPLVIYGPSGLGKTHLLHALGHYVHTYHEHLRVKYVSTEEMTNDFINAIADSRTAQFRRMYRDVDVLLIDDIQFLEKKIQTQEEFFHTFNHLHNLQKQIVMTCDRPPKHLEALEPRLRSRFEWGLLTDVHPPDPETRSAILRKKATSDGLTVPNDVLEFIASKISSNIRELEGALIRVTAYASLNQQTVDLDLAMAVLKDIIAESSEHPITIGMIINETAGYFGLTVEDLTGPGRAQSVALARQIAMYLSREYTESSLPKIGQAFGGRDHTTVMHANRKIKELIYRDRDALTKVNEITNRVKQTAQRRA